VISLTAQCAAVVLSMMPVNAQAVAETSASSFTVSGRIVDSRGKAPGNLEAWLYYDYEDAPGHTGGAGVPLGAGGTFEFRHVKPGRYVVAGAPKSEPEGILPGFEGGWVIVTVQDRDVADIVVHTHPTVSIRGHVRYDSDDPDAQQPVINVLSMLAVSGMNGVGGQSARVAADGTFVLHNVFGPSVIRTGYALAPGQPPWWAGPVLLDGRDITNEPVEFEHLPDADIEVVFTQRHTGLHGTVLDEAGLPAEDAYAVVFSSNESFQQPWSSATRIMHCDDRGRFYFSVPAGSYLAIAIPDAAFSSPREALRHLRLLSRNAVVVDVVEGSDTAVQLERHRMPHPSHAR
jgi:hypothetical protein